MFCGGEVFLQGVFAFVGCLVMANRGDVVVNCVVNRGVWRAVFGWAKIFLFFEIFFVALERFGYWRTRNRRSIPLRLCSGCGMTTNKADGK